MTEPNREISSTSHDWDQHYVAELPPWESGQPSSELARVLAEEKTKPCRVIEFGCGSGVNAVWLAQQGFEVTGIDISPRALERAKRRAESAGVSVKYVLGDVLDLREEFAPFPMFFDRGCYHAVRRIDVAAYIRSLESVTSPAAQGLILSGNAKSTHEPGQGPPTVNEEELRAELEPAFKIVKLREFQFDVADPSHPTFLGWSCWLRRS